MEVDLNVNDLTILSAKYIDSELYSLTNKIYSNININKYIGNGFNIFSAKYLNNMSSIKSSTIIENFYNDKYFFFRSDIKNIEKEVNKIVDSWIEEYFKNKTENINASINKIINIIKANNNYQVNYRINRNNKLHDINKFYYDLTIGKITNDINSILINRLNYHKK
ncbi:hypothetical protein [Caloramator sp. ALD01]|uniref:hypothetical protein n=1 Tax=Caloramator sp. ALD01 TaxID=1031288 RepID=UPI000429F3A5|nr:hypothetical protein [Caloramator sp. ALD01]